MSGLQADIQQLQAEVTVLREQAEHTARSVQGNVELEARLATLESMLFDGRRVVAQA